MRRHGDFCQAAQVSAVQAALHGALPPGMEQEFRFAASADIPSVAGLALGKLPSVSPHPYRRDGLGFVLGDCRVLLLYGHGGSPAEEGMEAKAVRIFPAGLGCPVRVGGFRHPAIWDAVRGRAADRHTGNQSCRGGGISVFRPVYCVIQPEVVGIFLASLYIRPIGGEAPFDLPITQIFSASVQTWEDMGHYEELRQNLSCEVSLLRNEGSIPYLVLILGESTQRNLMHLYGYYLPNTPHLDKLAESGELAFFRDECQARHGGCCPCGRFSPSMTHWQGVVSMYQSFGRAAGGRI